MRAILFAAALCGMTFVAPTARADEPAVRLLTNASVDVPTTNVTWRGYYRGGWGGYGYRPYYSGYRGYYGGYRPYYGGYRGYGYGYYGPRFGVYYRGW